MLIDTEAGLGLDFHKLSLLFIIQIDNKLCDVSRNVTGYSNNTKTYRFK